MAKSKFKLKDKTKIAWDPETNITWTGEKVFESGLTSFVAKCIQKGVLVETKEDVTIKTKTKITEPKETREEKIMRLKGVVEEKVIALEKADEESFEQKKKDLEKAEADLKLAEK